MPVSAEDVATLRRLVDETKIAVGAGKLELADRSTFTFADGIKCPRCGTTL